MEIIIGENAGFCHGVKRTVDNAIKEAKTGATYCLGEIVHNQNVVDKLEKEGIIFINNIEEAKELNIPLIDLTCPSVLKIQQMVEEYSKKEFFIIIVGNNNHPEIIGIKSRAKNKYIVIANIEELNEKFEKFQNEKNILLISQTTHSSKKFDEIAEELKRKLNDNTNLEIKKTICPSTEIRQKETDEISKKVEMMIIIGDKKSSNTNKLYDISCKYCNKVLFIANEKELDIKEIEGANKIGIMAGASTPKEDVIKVKNKLEEV